MQLILCNVLFIPVRLSLLNLLKEFKILANLNSNDDHYSELLKSGTNINEIENWKKNKTKVE